MRVGLIRSNSALAESAGWRGGGRQGPAGPGLGAISRPRAGLFFGGTQRPVQVQRRGSPPSRAEGLPGVSWGVKSGKGQEWG